MNRYKREKRMQAASELFGLSLEETEAYTAINDVTDYGKRDGLGGWRFWGYVFNREVGYKIELFFSEKKETRAKADQLKKLRKDKAYRGEMLKTYREVLWPVMDTIVFDGEGVSSRCPEG